MLGLLVAFFTPIAGLRVPRRLLLGAVGPTLADHPDQRVPLGVAAGAVSVLPFVLPALRNAS
jgi:hypothetical protein